MMSSQKRISEIHLYFWNVMLWSEIATSARKPASIHPPSEKKCTDKKLRVSKAQFLNFLARVSELKVPLRDKADGILIWFEQCNNNNCFFNTFRNNKSLKSGLQEMLTISSLKTNEGRVWLQKVKKIEGLARTREFLMNGVGCKVYNQTKSKKHAENLLPSIMA